MLEGSYLSLRDWLGRGANRKCQVSFRSMRDGAAETLVVVMGYGECAPGFIPTRKAVAEGRHDYWEWADPWSAEDAMRVAGVQVGLLGLRSPRVNSSGVSGVSSNLAAVDWANR